MERRADSYGEFWPHYLAEHSRPGNRVLHLFGTGLALLLLGAAVLAWDWRLLPAAVLAGYAFAWSGHALIERNRPATFTHPAWSLFSDFRMFALGLTGRLGAELERHGLPPR